MPLSVSALADGVVDGIRLYEDTAKHQFFVHLPPDGFLLVEEDCLQDPACCRRDGDGVILMRCTPGRLEDRQIRFRRQSSPDLPRLVLAHLSRRLVDFDQSCPEPPGCRVWAAPDTHTQQHWQTNSHNVPLNGDPACTDHECWLLVGMNPGERIKVTFSFQQHDGQPLRIQARGDVVICRPDGSICVEKVRARKY